LKKLKLDIALVLPRDASACNACAGRIIESLRDRPGISHVHVDTEEAAKPRLCLHYDPDMIDIARVRSLVEQAGGRAR
jgi:Cd2+/Zn2+-exporting ATPase